MGFPVCIHRLHELLCIPLCLYRKFFLYHLFDIGIRFDMSSVHKDHTGSQITGFCNLTEYPVEDLVYSFPGEAVTEVIADGGEMGCFFWNGRSTQAVRATSRPTPSPTS